MKKSILLSVMVLLMAAVFISCEKEEEIVEFKVVSIEPANKATGVSINASVVITFSKAIDTISYAFGQGGGGSLVKKLVSSDKKVVTLDPVGVMKRNTLYGLAIVDAISEDGDTLTLISKNGNVIPLMNTQFTTEN
jgi:hypothetical protein